MPYLATLQAAWKNCGLPTRLAVVGAAIAVVNVWLGIVVALAAAWNMPGFSLTQNFRERLWFWWSIPLILALISISYGSSLPPDDLMRHLSAWQLGYDYRAQYPWADIPKIDPWFGYDHVLGGLQQLGIPKKVLWQWIPGFGLILNSVVIYGMLRRAVPKHRLHPELFLLLGSLGLLLITPRVLLGRPESFLALLGASVWLVRTRWQMTAWVLAFLVSIPCYWLDWAYAPFALLLPIRSLWTRLGLVVLLALVHLGFWQVYSGDYVGLLLWARATLSVPATENWNMITSFGLLAGWLFALLLSWTLSIPLRYSSNPAKRKKLLLVLPFVTLIAWFVLPNQIRYLAVLVLAVLPWLLRTIVGWWTVQSKRQSLSIHPVVVLAVLVYCGIAQVATFDGPPTFALAANSRVYAEQSFAIVFYGTRGISVEPSFALGATKKAWKNMEVNGAIDCRRLRLGGFTHVVEKSLTVVPTCTRLEQIQGPWRLWRVVPVNRN